MQNCVTIFSRGLCIYCQDALSVEEYTLLKNNTFDKSFWGDFRLRKKQKLLLGGVYRSPTSDLINSERLNRNIFSAI